VLFGERGDHFGRAVELLTKWSFSSGAKRTSGWSGIRMTRPAKAEAEGVHRAIAIAEMADAPVYIVHLSCYDALKEVQAARDLGLPVYAETCPQYLFLDNSSYESPGFEGAKYVMSPPLRDKANQEHLWRGLRDNDLQFLRKTIIPQPITISRH
jgi:dihydroorotase-like cyclic amidohydrolase